MASALRRFAGPVALQGLRGGSIGAQLQPTLGMRPLRPCRSLHLPHGNASEIVGNHQRSFASAAGANERDPYKVLGIDRNASPEEIKKAYRKEALKWHPDKNPENRKEAEKRFGAVANAYETLSDPEKKRQFEMGGSHPGGFRAGSPGGFQASGGFHSQADAERLFRDVFGAQSMDDVFGQLFGRQQSAPRGPRTLQVGTDVEVLPDAGAVLGACRQSGIDSTNDSLRVRSLGKRGRIIKVDPKDQSVKVKIAGVGDVWFAARSVRPFGGSGSAGLEGAFRGFGGNFGNFGSAGMSGGGVVQMRQEVVTLPDGRRAVRVTRVQRAPDGTLQEEISETPLQ